MIVHDGDISEPVPIKRGRGRPRLGTSSKNNTQSNKGSKLKKKRGRPKKYFYPEDLDRDAVTLITGERAVVKCCALSCTNTSASFVMCKLPTDRALLQQWLAKIRRPGWTCPIDAALCQIHFEPDMWIHEPKLRLKPTAVPTMFLQGENIKSWVTMDHSGNVRNLVVGSQTNGNVEDEQDEMDIEGVTIKSEVLEPEIDMVVENDDEEPFITQFCNTGYKTDGGDYGSSAGLTINSVFSQDAECILPDVYSPASPDHKVNMNGLGVHLLADRVKGFACPLCAKRLSRRRSLVQHMQRIHPGTEETKQIMEERAWLHRTREKAIKMNSPPVPENKVLEPILPKAVVTSSVGTSPLPTVVPANNNKAKPFFLLIPANFQPTVCPPPLMASSSSTSPTIPPSLASSSWDASDMFCVTLKPLPLTTRTALKRKLMDLVEAVTVRNIPPQKIIIAYSNVNKDEEAPSSNVAKSNGDTPRSDAVKGKGDTPCSDVPKINTGTPLIDGVKSSGATLLSHGVKSSSDRSDSHTVIDIS